MYTTACYLFSLARRNNQPIQKMTRVFTLALLVLLSCNKSFATAWTTSTAGAVNSLSNWTDGSVSPSSFTTPGDTWTIDKSMTLPASAVWTLGTAASTAVTVTFATGGTISMSGAGSTFTINIHGNMDISGGTLSLGGAGTTANVTVNGNATMSAGAANSIASSTHLNVTVNGLFTMTGGSIATSGASSVINWDTRGNFSMNGGTFVAGGAGSTLTHNIYGNGSYSGTAAMTNTGAGCTGVVHFALPSSTGTMLIDNTSTGTWSGTNIFVDAGCEAQLDGNFSTTTGAAAFGLTVNGTLICPAAYAVNGSRKFTLSSLATLVAAHTSGINGAITTTGTRTFSADANYTFNGAAAQVTGSYLPASLLSPSVLTISNAAGVTLTASVITTGTLAFTSGILNTGPATMSTPGAAAAVTGAGAGSYVNGTLIKTITGLTSINYEVGDLNYAPMLLSLSSVGTAGSLGVMANNGMHPSVGTSGFFTTYIANHFWRITNAAAAGPIDVTPMATYNFVDIIGGSNAAFQTQQFVSGAWLPTPLATTNTSSPYTSAPVIGRPLASLAGEYIFGGTCSVLPITGTPAVCAGSFAILADATPGGTWSSSSPSIATISGSGVVSGIAPGTTTIYYTTSACAVSVVVTVSTFPSPGTLSGTTSVCVGAATGITGTGTGGTWSSSSTGIATVSSLGVVTGVAPGVATISYTVTNICGTASATINVTVTAAPFASPIAGASSLCVGSTITKSDPTPGGVWSSSTPTVATISTFGVVSGIAPGTSTIYYTVTNSCGVYAASSVITVNTTPTVAAITGITDVCVGSTAVLANSTPGGVWSSGGITIATISAGGIVSAITAGTAVISYRITNSCGTATATVAVTVGDSIAITPILGKDSVCPGFHSTLTCTPAGGVWSSMIVTVATVSPTGVVTGITPGYDTIVYTVTNVCGTAVAKFEIKVRDTEGCPVITATSLIDGPEAGLNIFPNPNTGSFTVNLNTTENEVLTIVVTDIAGRKVLEQATTTNKATNIQLRQPPGIYFVAATTPHNRYNVKVVVE
jgi:uncharacterized protein YjdB